MTIIRATYDDALSAYQDGRDDISRNDFDTAGWSKDRLVADIADLLGDSGHRVEIVPTDQEDQADVPKLRELMRDHAEFRLRQATRQDEDDQFGGRVMEPDDFIEA